MSEPTDRTLHALLALGALAVLLLAGAVLFVGLTARAPGPVPTVQAASSRPDAGPAPIVAELTDWSPAGASLSKAVDVAFVAGATLSTDGKQASFDSGDGVARPVEVPASIPRVFGAAGRLFAAGENDGAPFLILLVPGEDPLVVPASCAASRLAGEGNVVALLCEDGSGLALSSDGGKSFHEVTFELPSPREASPEAEVEKALEAIAVSPSGALAVASSQRWQADQAGGALLWTWGQIAWRAAGSRSFRFSNVQALVRTVGLHLSGGALTLAGLEVAVDGPSEGSVRARLFRGTEGEPPLPVGEPGPVCGTAQTAKSVEGVLLGTRIAAFRCGEALVTSFDGGATWRTERGLGAMKVVRGGDMRLFARAGERVFERRFVNRSDTGATAVRLAGSSARPVHGRDGGETGPVSAAVNIHEPSPDGGAGRDAERP